MKFSNNVTVKLKLFFPPFLTFSDMTLHLLLSFLYTSSPFSGGLQVQLRIFCQQIRLFLTYFSKFLSSKIFMYFDLWLMLVWDASLLPNPASDYHHEDSWLARRNRPFMHFSTPVDRQLGKNRKIPVNTSVTTPVNTDVNTIVSPWLTWRLMSCEKNHTRAIFHAFAVGHKLFFYRSINVTTVDDWCEKTFSLGCSSTCSIHDPLHAITSLVTSRP